MDDLNTGHMDADEMEEAWLSFVDKLSDNPRLLDAPIDVAEHLGTSMLCMNRILNEKGVARIIVGYHKDLLAMDVIARIEKFVIDPSLLADNNLMPFLQETAGYIKCYLNNDEFILMVVAMLLHLANETNDAVRKAIDDARILDTLMATIGNRPQEGIYVFITLVSCLILSERTRSLEELSVTGDQWRNNMVDRLLDAGLGDHVIRGADIAESWMMDETQCEFFVILVCFLFYHLDHRPLNPHYAVRHRLLGVMEGWADPHTEQQPVVGIPNEQEHRPELRNGYVDVEDEDEHETRKGCCCFTRKRTE